MSRPVRNAFPGFRIFVFGQEVTEDVLSVSVNLADNIRAPSTAQFTLSDKPTGSGGAVSRYIVNRDDICAIYPSDIDPVTIQFPDSLPTLKNDGTDDFAVQFQKLQAQKRDFDLIQTFGPSGVHNLQSGENLIQRSKTFQDYEAEIDAAEDTWRRQALTKISAIPDPIKSRVLKAKFDKLQKVSQPAVYETGTKLSVQPQRAKSLLGQAFRYNFWANRPIFHSNDPVRIFYRDPLNPQFWFHMFAGFVSDWTVAKTANNEQTVMITCEDVLRIFRYARLTTNPGILDIDAVLEQEDFAGRTFYNNDFSYLTLPELLYFMVFGPEQAHELDLLAKQGNLDDTTLRAIRLRQKGADPKKLTRYSVNGTSQQTVPAFGVGAFNIGASVTYIFGPSTDAPQLDDNTPKTPALLVQHTANASGPDALAVYQAIVDHQVRISDVDDLRLQTEQITPRSSLERDPITNAPSVDAIIKELGENPHKYPVDAGKLIILTPRSLGANVNRNILERDYKGPEMVTPWKSRLEIILDLSERVEFSFYASPKGDLIFEMPLYDFGPEDFGTGVVTNSIVRQTIDDSTFAGRVLRHSLGRVEMGPFAPHYRVRLGDTGDSQQTFVDNEMRTQTTTPFQLINCLKEGETSALVQAPEVTTLRSLIPQFGVRTLANEPPVFIHTAQAAQVYGQLQLNKTNANALTSTIDIIPMLRMGPNRPIEFDDGPYIATLRSVSRRVDWTSREVAQNVGVNYTRVWDGQTDPNNKNRLLYLPIGGAASRPLNYSILFNLTIPSSSTKTRGTPGGLT